MDIKPYINNAKEHPDKQLKQIAASLKAFGWLQPIVVDKNNGIIVGHGRLMAYEKYPEGIKEPWIIKAEDLSEQQVKAYRLADNKLNESKWNLGLVIEELKGLSKEMFDLTGFDEDILVSKEDKDDVIPENVEPKAKMGDIYQLGNHMVMCGDATNKNDVGKLMNNIKADMVFTDPPYNVNYTGMKNMKEWNEIKNDNLSPEQFKSFLEESFRNYYNFTTQKAAMYLCYADENHREFRDSFEKASYDWRATIIWIKNIPAFNFAQYKFRHEPIFYCFKKGEVVNWYGDRTNNTGWKEEWSDKKIADWLRKQNDTTVWEAKKEHGDHPTIKPVELITKAILNSSKRGNIILDLFLGSGSTLIASEKTDRICYGMELEPKYVDVIIKRYEDYTNQKALLIQ